MALAGEPVPLLPPQVPLDHLAVARVEMAHVQRAFLVGEVVRLQGYVGAAHAG